MEMAFSSLQARVDIIKEKLNLLNLSPQTLLQYYHRHHITYRTPSYYYQTKLLNNKSITDQQYEGSTNIGTLMMREVLLVYID
jgi:hypothetical protein